LRAFSRSVADPFELLGQLDTALKEFPAGSQYATVLLIRWCPESSQLQICSGGSPPPILLRNGKVSQIELNGTPVGLPIPSVFTQTDLTVLSGDLLVLYSDGISDQPGPDGIHYGDERLADVIRQTGQGSLDQIAGSLLEDLENYRGDTEQHDDQMLLLIQVT
jgi:sigma-B regulation protein RsbU (phosphoserine phosphatase)